MPSVVLESKDTNQMKRNSYARWLYLPSIRTSPKDAHPPAQSRILSATAKGVCKRYDSILL